MSEEKHKSAELTAQIPAGLSRLLAHNDVLFAMGLAVVLATLLVPLPTFLLDLLLSCSIAVSLATLVIVLSAQESIEFSTFPSLLLVVTLFRLSLNVASTRLILLNGQAGQIINTFGNFVAGGNLVIGLVVFLILVVIQFVVITKGSERISEVAARFNLDAMPGKQMAIDADLNAGSIGEQEARQRRQKITRENEFYGAMDGASKFIRGDAIAGLIITAVNLVGGFAVGLVRGMTLQDSIRTYSILAIGDGLVSQIPAIIVSTASGFLVSKTTSQGSISHDLVRQFLAKPRPLGIAAFLLAAMVLVPGFPKTPFVALALGCGLLARALAGRERALAAQKTAVQPAAAADEAPLEELLDVDRVCIQVGPRLIRTVDPRRKGSLSHRIGPLRRKFAQEYGLLLPLVRLQDSPMLDGTRYEIRMNNHVVGSGLLEPDKFLAMDGGGVQTQVQGSPAREPVFDLPALWIDPAQKDEAERNGYTIVDPETVLTTHLSEALRRHAYELLNRDDVQKLVDRLRDKQPALVNAVVGEIVPIGVLQRILQNLLRDGIPIKDLQQIIETAADHAPRTKDPSVLTEHVRKALVRTITEKFADAQGAIQAVALDPSLECELRGALGKGSDGEMLALMPQRALELARALSEAWASAMNQGKDKTVLVCDHRLRPHLAMLLTRQAPQLSVLAFEEIAIGTKVDVVATVVLRPATGGAVAAGGAE